MALLWGRELILVYNDAYRLIAGGKHPAALGHPTREIWPEDWHLHEPLFAAVMERGETVYLEDALFPIDRHGVHEEAYFTLCYSPVRSEGGSIGGTLVTLQETTSQVLERKRKRDEELLRDHERELRAALARLRIHVETTPLALVEGRERAVQALRDEEKSTAASSRTRSTPSTSRDPTGPSSTRTARLAGCTA